MAVGSTKASSTAKRHRLWLGAALFALVAVLVLVWGAEDTADVVIADTSAPARVVSVLDVTPAEAVTTVAAFAELRPRWDAEIRSAVPGRILRVHDAALAGGRVDAGALLFSIETTPYETELAAAELNLEQARLALWQAKNAVVLARGEFERAGTEPPNALALRLPQLRIAERSVASAEAQLQAAQRRLADTEVVAPFCGFVTERMASLGQTVVAGESLVRLSDDQRFESVVELSEADWALLEHPIAGGTVELFHRDGTALGRARIREGGGFLDPQTRQRRVFLDVRNAASNVLAGDFVRVEFTGRTIENTLAIPESALTRTGHVWFVDTDDLLGRFEPRILFRSDGRITLAAPNGADSFRIAATPLASFLPGQRVSPRRIGGIAAVAQAARASAENRSKPMRPIRER